MREDVPEPETYVAVPRSFSASVGVPLTVTFLDVLSVSRTVLPKPRSPLPELMPGPDASRAVAIGAVSIGVGVEVEVWIGDPVLNAGSVVKVVLLVTVPAPTRTCPAATL